MKSRTNQQENGAGNEANQKENTRANNRKSDSHFADQQSVAHIKECGLCKAEFSMFKWRVRSCGNGESQLFFFLSLSVFSSTEH